MKFFSNKMNFNLTREYLENNTLDILFEKDKSVEFLNNNERLLSIKKMLKYRPEGDCWIFGYGSLIWNPLFEYEEKRLLEIKGWHRSFCLSITNFRASKEKPGFMLALEEGGTCQGIAYRIAEEKIINELILLWKREMICNFYIPKWVKMNDKNGVFIGYAITFVINDKSQQYVRELNQEMVVNRLSTASGEFGSAADYLFKTYESLITNEIKDSSIKEIKELVEMKMNGC
jgi:cation transport protein ChaC